jgi:leucyl aminopeptidase
MAAIDTSEDGTAPAEVVVAADAQADARLIWPLTTKDMADDVVSGLQPLQKAWLRAAGFQAQLKRVTAVPAADHSVAGYALGLGDGVSGEPAGPASMLLGQVAGQVPPGRYRLSGPVAEPELAAVAWGLGAYRFRRYKSQKAEASPKLEVPPGVDHKRVTTIVEGVWLGRDLINTPASDMGPAELEQAVRKLGERHGADVSAVVGDDLLAQNFPMIHAVGRASPRQPRLIDLRWGRADAPRVTLVGKGICFDTGGLDLKPSSAMLLMKKDMGGAATVLALGHMIMGLGLDVRLRILVPAAENSVAGNAFRPLDVITSRSGLTVEIGNTDAEGRLVLSDALSLADEETPDTLLTFSTLTGAARVALGPDLPPLYTDDTAFAAELVEAGMAVGDPVWRMPFWSGYERMLDSEVADMGNVSDGPFAGSIVAALFLRRFVKNARRFAHFDIYGWRPAPKALGPKGGEPHAARSVLHALQARYGR